MNLGTTGYELHRFDQMFGNQNSTSMTEDTGRVVMNTAEGGRLTINPDDSQTYNAADARSNLNMNLGLSERIGSELRSTAGRTSQPCANPFGERRASSIPAQKTACFLTAVRTQAGCRLRSAHA